MKKFKLSMLTLIALTFGMNCVLADSPECHGGLGNYSSKVAIGEEFIYDVGTMGASSNTYIDELNYVIEYDADDLEVVNVNGKPAGAYNGWYVEAFNDTNTGLRVNRVTISASTDNHNKTYNDIITDEFVKIAYVKFRVKTKTESSTSIQLVKDESYYHHYFDDGEGYNQECYNSSVTVVNIYSKDSNATLSSLAVNNGELNPKFNANTTSYDVVVNNEVDTIQIDGTCSGTNCKLNGTGLKKLVVGENKFTISVTSETGTNKTYTLNVTRREKDEVFLERLLIKDVDLYPVFKSETTNYIINVSNDVNKLDLEYVTNNDEVNKVEITGNEDLKVGKNYVTITVKNEENGMEQSYEILVIKEDKVVTEAKKEKSKFNLFIIFTVVFALISLAELIILIVSKKKSKKKEIVKEDTKEEKTEEIKEETSTELPEEHSEE